ncbi:MAG: hypothetical protein WC610_01025 [Patescibacteria group bacterium]
MTINDLIQLLNNRLREFQLSRDYARMSGDLERMNVADKEILSLEDTLYKLNLLVDTSKSAAIREVILAEVITDGSVAVLGEYDITLYATDPLHEKKIMNILSKMGVMETVEKIDAYIKGKYLSSPVTGEMVMSAASAYSVDARLMMAIMEQDSSFATAGKAVRTLNPGNVGNDDSGNLRTYDSWQEGVTAVAAWLSRHRGLTTISEIPEENVLEPTATSQPEAGPPLAETTLTTTTTTATATTTPAAATSTPETIPVITSTTTTATTTPAVATSTPETIPVITSTTTTATTTPFTTTSTPETTPVITSQPEAGPPLAETTSTTTTTTTATTTPPTAPEEPAPATATSTPETIPVITSTTTTATTTTSTATATE